jgi:hypothetical protein
MSISRTTVFVTLTLTLVVRAEPVESVDVLDASSYWRCLFAHSPPVVRKGKRIENLEPDGKRWSAPLAANWMEIEIAVSTLRPGKKVRDFFFKTAPWAK